MARIKRAQEGRASSSHAEDEVTVAEAGIPMGQPWKPVVIERFRDVEEYNRTKYSAPDYRIANIPSSIKTPFFDLLQTEFYIPDGYEIRRPEVQERMYWQPKGGWIPIHRLLLLFGVRFPLRPFLIELLHTVGLSLNQLAPNSFIHLNSFIAFCYAESINPALDFFFRFFSLTACKEKGFFQIIKNTDRETLIDTPSSNKGWHGDWFFIRGPDTELVGPWSNPNKEQLNPNRISRRRFEEFEALYSRRPSVKWNRLLLNDQDWLHAHGRKC